MRFGDGLPGGSLGLASFPCATAAQRPAASGRKPPLATHVCCPFERLRFSRADIQTGASR